MLSELQFQSIHFPHNREPDLACGIREEFSGAVTFEFIPDAKTHFRSTLPRYSQKFPCSRLWEKNHPQHTHVIGLELIFIRIIIMKMADNMY